MSVLRADGRNQGAQEGGSSSAPARSFLLDLPAAMAARQPVMTAGRIIGRRAGEELRRSSLRAPHPGIRNEPEKASRINGRPRGRRWFPHLPSIFCNPQERSRALLGVKDPLFGTDSGSSRRSNGSTPNELLIRPGGHSARAPPGSIPNPAVKPRSAQGTALLRVGERVAARSDQELRKKAEAGRPRPAPAPAPCPRSHDALAHASSSSHHPV